MDQSQDLFQSLRPFLGKLKSDAPTPGGGAVAGLLGALAAALSHMVASLTVNKKKYAEHQSKFQDAMPHMEAALEDFYGLMLEDVEVFDAYMQTIKLPKESDDEKAHRKIEMRRAAENAARVPMESLRLANKILPLVRLSAECGNKNAISDAGMAAILVAAAAKSASMNVKINLGSLPAEEAKPLADELIALLGETLKEAETIEALVLAKL